MDEKCPPSRATRTPAPEPESEYSRFLKALEEIREIQRLTANLEARPAPRSGAERRGPATRSARGPSVEPLDIPCPAGLRRATYRRLVKRHETLRAALMKLSYRQLSPRVRNRLATQFRTALRRVRRALGLPEWEPGQQTWYSLSAAAGYLGISPRTLLRWDAAGIIIASGQTPGGHRRFHHRDLSRRRAAQRP
ncbi:MAG TPA: helix-turn-helix domain-containing protein [Blastocatellia bacterium]|nr:helix-turn-helix domain-containing protein [Blastocatellia bacterium]